MDSPITGPPAAPFGTYQLTFENPRLFSSNFLHTSENVTSCNFITFLSAVQDLGLEIVPLQWQSARRSIGEGGTSQISQAFVNPETSIAFKRVSELDKLQLDDEEILRRLISEIVVLGNEHIRGHPHILELQGVSWDVSPEPGENSVESSSTGSPKNGKVWPVLMFEMSRYGDLNHFAGLPVGRSLDHRARLDFCIQIGAAIATMHSTRVIHGDIKPQNVIVFKLDDGSFIPKVADFGYSSPYSDHELLINLPESYPWYAPELHEYPNFTPSQASTADIFSYGMLCLWLIFEKYLSGHESLPEASTAMVLKYTDEDGNASLKNLADLRSNISPLELSDYLIGANKELDTQARLPLRRFFHGTLALDPNERSTDLSQVISHLDVGNETVRDEVDATKYNPPLAEDFHLSQSLHALYLCDYRLRSHIVKCLEEIATSDPAGPVAGQLGMCYAIGFGHSATTEEQRLVGELAKKSGLDVKALLNEGPSFMENVGELFASLFESRHMAEMESLAGIYREHNVLEEAIRVTRHEFESLSQVLGSENPITLSLGHVLSLILHSDAQWGEAEKLAKHCVDALGKSLGEHHDDTLQIKLHLATIYYEQGRWQDAETLERHVLDVRLNQFGKEDPLTLACMASLTATYSSQGRWEEAERLGIDVMDVSRQLFGLEHPTTLAHMSVMADLYYSQAKLEKAMDLQTEVMDLTDKVLGSYHPDTIGSISSLAKMFWKSEIWKEGLQLQVDAVDAGTRHLGPKHPDTLKMMASLANMCGEMGEHEEAEKLYREILDTRRQTLGAEHPDTLKVLTNLAFILGEQGKHKESGEIELAVLEIMERVLGPSHPDTLTTMSNLAFTWKCQGEHEKSVALMEECLVRQKQRLGPDHPDVLETLETLEEWQSPKENDMET